MVKLRSVRSHAPGLLFPLNCPLQMTNAWGDAFFFSDFFLYTPPPPRFGYPPAIKIHGRKAGRLAVQLFIFLRQAFRPSTALLSRPLGAGAAVALPPGQRAETPGRPGPPPPGGGSAERPAPAQPRRGCGRKSPGRRLRSGTGKGGKVAFSDFGLNPHPPGWTRGDSPRRASLLRVWVRTRGSGHLSPCSPCRCCCGVPPSAHGQAHKQTGRLAANASGSRPLSSLSGPLPSARVSGKNRGEGRVKLSALGGGGWLGSKVGSRASATAPHRRLLLE